MAKVKAILDHTYDGKTYHVGDTYEADDQYLETIVSTLKYVELVAEAPTPAAEPAKPKK